MLTLVLYLRLFGLPNWVHGAVGSTTTCGLNSLMCDTIVLNENSIFAFSDSMLANTFVAHGCRQCTDSSTGKRPTTLCSSSRESGGGEKAWKSAIF